MLAQLVLAAGAVLGFNVVCYVPCTYLCAAPSVAAAAPICNATGSCRLTSHLSFLSVSVSVAGSFSTGTAGLQHVTACRQRWASRPWGQAHLTPAG